MGQDNETTGGKKQGAAQLSGTVTKALSLLDAFLDGYEKPTLTQLATYSGINKSTVLRLCTSLEESGLLLRAPGEPYSLGPKIWQLAQVYRRSFSIEGIIRPMIARIRDETGESAGFYVIDGNERLCLIRENSKAVIRHHVDEGSRFPLESGVVGPVLLAFAGKTGRNFDGIRSAGYLIDQGREPDTTSVAVPVFDSIDQLRGALVVAGPSSRFGQPECDRALRDLLDASTAIRRSLPGTYQ